MCTYIRDFSYNRAVPLNPDQLLLRGAQLRNTQWIYGKLNVLFIPVHCTTN